MTRIYLSKDGVVRTPDAGEHSHHSMAKTILGPGWCGDVEDAYAAMWQAGWVRVVETVDKVNGERYLNGQPVPFNELTPEQRGWFEGKRALEGKLFIWNDQEFASTREARPGDGKTRNYPFHYEAQFAALLGTYSELLENKQTSPEGTMDEYEAKLKTLGYDELLNRWLAACPDYEYARTAFDCMPADEQLRRLIGLADGHLRAETHWPLLGKFITALRYRRRDDTLDFAAAGGAIITAYNQRLTEEQRERVKTHVAGEVDFGSVVQGERREPWFIDQFSPIGGYYSPWMLHVLGSTVGMVCNTVHPRSLEKACMLNQMLGGTPARFVWLFLDFREDPRKYWDPDRDDHVIDQLGACFHAVSDPIYFIVLHMRGIAKAAEDLGHPEQAHDLGMLVFLHEFAHGVHLGLRDLDGVRNPAAPKPWSRRDWIELVAQLLTWNTIKDDPKLAALFEAWTDISPPEYQRWRTMRDCSMEDFRAYLWFLRRNGASKNGLDFQTWFCADHPQLPPLPKLEGKPSTAPQ